MRTILAFAAAVLVTAAIGPLPAAAQAPTQDSASGDVTLGGDSTIHRVTIDARSGPSGENPTGTVSTSGTNGELSGTVTCLNVAGNDAIVVYQVPGLQQPSAIELVDFAATPGQPDVVAFPILSDPANCHSAPTRPRFPIAIASGDLVVVDAAPLPTTKDQCKNGGWRSFPGFKNQGQCVRFVRHQARQDCISERAAIGRPAFRAKYGKGPHKLRAMRHCIGQTVNGHGPS